MPRAAPAPVAAAPQADDRELLPLSEFLRKWSVSKSAFYRYAAAGDAPGVVKLGRATFVPMAEARAWLAKRIRPASELCRGAAVTALLAIGLAIAAHPAKAQMFGPQQPPQQQQQQVIIPQDDSAQAAQQACIGAVVGGVCEGTAAPDAQTATCYGQMIGGVCAGSLQPN